MTLDARTQRPLDGALVLDVSRMLPGAVLARMLVGFGARVVKIEDPRRGDPMRWMPPLVDGVGASFRAFYAGVESVCLDLREPSGSEALRRLAERADVFVESFRPGTLERWGVGRDALMTSNPGLVVCSLSSFGSRTPYAERIGHDLNFVAESGLLSLLPGEGVPAVQLADVTAGLLACSSVLAALLARVRTGRGALIDQPLALAPVPFLTLAWSELAAGGGDLTTGILAGRCPAYAIYTCADGARVALGALEPKFWVALLEVMGLGDLAGAGLDTGTLGRDAQERLAARFAERPRAEWLVLAAEHNLPLTPVRSAEEASRDPYYAKAADRPGVAAPHLGEHTAAVLAEIGYTGDGTSG